MKRNRNLLIFLFFASVFILFSNGHYGGDGLENYLTAESIVLDGDIAIHDRAFEIKEMKYAPRGKMNSEGKYFSHYGIGMPILLVPLYAFGHMLSKFFPSGLHDYVTQFCVSMSNPIIIALTALSLFIFLQKLKFSIRTCYLTVLAYCFCTMTLIYTRSGFSEPAIALFLMAAFFFLYMYEKTSLIRYALLAGFLVSYTLLIKRNTFLYLPLLACYIIFKTIARRLSIRESLKLLMAIAAPILLFALLYLYSHIFMESNVSSAVAGHFYDVYKSSIEYKNLLFKGLYYNLFCSGKGFFFYNIPLILALFGIKHFAARDKGLAIYCGVFILTNFLFYSYIFRRGSLFSWGPRYLYTIVPFMCIFLAEFIENAKSLSRKILLVVFCIFGFLVQLPCLFINFTNYLIFIKEKMGLSEYLINFMPELNPIRGVWLLFVSAVSRVVAGASLSFTFNPDYLFYRPITGSLAGYDNWDIWWVNVGKVSLRLFPLVIITIVLLVLIVIISVIKIKNQINYFDLKN